MKWMREHVVASWAVTVIRLVLGWAWLTAGWHKVTGGFDASGFLKNAINNPVMDKATGEAMYPTFTNFLEHVALPNVKIINILIPWGEFLVGLGLVLGCLTTIAVFFGLLMNFMFLFAGTVSSNPWLVLLGVVVFIAGTNAGKIGLDRWVMPWLKHALRRRKDKENLNVAEI